MCWPVCTMAVNQLLWLDEPDFPYYFRLNYVCFSLKKQKLISIINAIMTGSQMGVCGITMIFVSIWLLLISTSRILNKNPFKIRVSYFRNPSPISTDLKLPIRRLL